MRDERVLDNNMSDLKLIKLQAQTLTSFIFRLQPPQNL